MQQEQLLHLERVVDGVGRVVFVAHQRVRPADAHAVGDLRLRVHAELQPPVGGLALPPQIISREKCPRAHAKATAEQVHARLGADAFVVGAHLGHAQRLEAGLHALVGEPDAHGLNLCL